MILKSVCKKEVAALIKKNISIKNDSIESKSTELEIRFDEKCEVQRFGCELNEAEKRSFDFYSMTLWNLFVGILKEFSVNELYIAKYSYKWYSDIVQVPQLSLFLKTDKKRADFAGGIFTDDFELIKEIYFSALTYNMFPLFIFTQPEFIITPTDHMDLFIDTSDGDVIAKIKGLINQEPFKNMQIKERKK